MSIKPPAKQPATSNAPASTAAPGSQPGKTQAAPAQKSGTATPTFSAREEIIFLYDATNSNPNGDPDEENRPREDPTTNKILVTDLRVKRTIRDFIDLHVSKEGTGSINQILVKREQASDLSTMQMDDLVYKMVYGNDWTTKKTEYESIAKKKTKSPVKPPKKNATKGKDATTKAESGNDPENAAGPPASTVDLEKLISMVKEIRDGLLKSAVDVRAFGAVTTLNKYPWTFTGPVQFSLGVSLNVPVIREIPISPIVATKADSTSGSLGNYKVVDYALIAVPGIACPVLAKNTRFSAADLALIYKALWLGTMALQSRSKANQVSRLLVAVVSKSPHFQVGGLAGLLRVEKEDKCLGIGDCKIVLDPFLARLVHFKEKVEKIKIKADPGAVFTFKGKETTIESALAGAGFQTEPLDI